MSELIKCLVWDLDNTLWSGVLAEGDDCRIRPGLRQVLKEADSRGILLSIASANEESHALAHLRKLGIGDLFICPQISWGDKVESLQHISEELGVALNAMGFVDDEPYQREKVGALLPEVRTYDSRFAKSLLERPEFCPGVLTEESRSRRRMYVQNKRRTQAETREKVSQKEFLRACRTELELRRANSGDAPRILELLQRTHQLNATGVVFGPDELVQFMESPAHRVFIASMKDRYVDYGRIGVVICHCSPDRWTILSFLLSCRVLGRGIGQVFLCWLEDQALANGVNLIEAHYVKQVRNRPMFVLYSMSGFDLADQGSENMRLFTKTCISDRAVPEWLMLNEGNGPCALSGYS